MKSLPNLLDTGRSPYQIILFLAWPTIIEQLLQTAVNYVDIAMVGTVGIDATAAIGVSQSTVWMINGLLMAISLGFAAIVGRSIGEGNLEKARCVIRQAVLSVFVVGAILTLAAVAVLGPNLARWMGADQQVIPLSQQYYTAIGSAYLFQAALVICANLLRVSGDTRTPMFFNILTNLINICGNFLLIYPTRQLQILGMNVTMPGAGLGVWGAAIATTLGIAFSGTCMLITLFRTRSELAIRLRDDYRPSRIIIQQAARLAFPTAVERVTISSGQIVMTALITSAGTAALSANQLANTGESLCYLPMFGFATAGTTLVSQALGAKREEQAIRYGTGCVKLAVLSITLLSIGMFLFAPQIMGVFTRDEQVIAMGATVLRIEAFAEPFQAIGTVLAGVLRGAGDTKWPFYVSLIGMWGVRVSVALILLHGFDLGLNAVWIAMAMDWVARASISMVRFYRKKWLYAWAGLRK